MQLRRKHNSDPKHGTKRASFSLEEVNFKERPSCFPQLDCFREFVPL